jgi:hypothetical protein
VVDTADEGKYVYDAESRNQALRDMEAYNPDDSKYKDL